MSSEKPGAKLPSTRLRRRLNLSLMTVAVVAAVAPLLVASQVGFPPGVVGAVVLAFGLFFWMSRLLERHLEDTLFELRETQAQLVLSERLAGLGMLVAAVAHEVNSPSAAIHGTAHALVEAVPRFTRSARAVAELPMSDGTRSRFHEICAVVGKDLSKTPLVAPAEARRRARDLGVELKERGLDAAAAGHIAVVLVELAASAEVVAAIGDIARACERPAAEVWPILVDYMREAAYVHRATSTIAGANDRIQSVVRDLKSYSHLDQTAEGSEVDLHEGIEHTLVLFDHLLAPGIKVTRKFGAVPPMVVYVDQLNQVWTNLIHNALQAMGGQGNLTIETDTEGDGAVVRVIDDGPGISREAMPHIFEPFFTTKARGEGSGLGLKIAQQIVDRHSGRVRVESRPGRTCFEVWLPRRTAADRPNDS